MGAASKLLEPQQAVDCTAYWLLPTLGIFSSATLRAGSCWWPRPIQPFKTMQLNIINIQEQVGGCQQAAEATTGT
jgi:hypothetical protein